MTEPPGAPGQPEAEPDTKDWTVVVDRPCEQCGFDPAGLSVADVGARLRASVPAWQAVLLRDDAVQRPRPRTWSPVEYACHVRDVCRVFRERVHRMLAEDRPDLPDWDGEQAAFAGRYAFQDATAVGQELTGELQATAAAWDGIPAGAEQRTGRRGDGREFTVHTLSRYFLHEVEHHLADAGGAG